MIVAGIPLHLQADRLILQKVWDDDIIAIVCQTFSAGHCKAE